VRDGLIEAVSRDRHPGTDDAETIDVRDAVVCPGFIDAHSHSDLRVLTDPTIPPKATQGVTTEVVGQDGFSVAPMYDDAEPFETYLSGLLGRTDGAWDWGSTAEYFDAIDEAGAAVNVATLVGHGTVRYNVMGMATRDPTDDELDEMEALVDEALEQGAVGLSTGLEYSPQLYAGDEELRALTGCLTPDAWPFVAHIRSYSDGMWDALDEFVDIGAEVGVPVHLSHFKLGGPNGGLADRGLHLARVARERGVDFTADLYPYAPGSSMLLALLPSWVHEKPPAGMRTAIGKNRERIRRDLSADDGWGSTIDWGDYVLSHVRSERNADLLGDSLAAVATRRETRPIDVVCDLLLEEDFEVGIVTPPSSPQMGTDVREVLADELVAIGSDGIFGRRPHPRLYGTFPRVLGDCARERNLFSVEEAVRKMTSLPARIFGFDSKGVLRSGMDADLVVFDPASVDAPATTERPTQFARGISHVLIDGVFTVRNADVTGNTPGTAVRDD